MRAKYINIFTDFGFKKLFGEEASKRILIDFLNALLNHPHKIVDITYKNAEHLGQTMMDRKAIYDIYCENELGEKFIVELQKAKQKYFKDRTIYYATFPIREQAEKGEWNYKLTAVYCIGILDFTFDDYDTEAEKTDVVHTIQLKNQHGKVFYDKLTYIYLEMPNFKKAERELETRLDKWLYFIKNLEDFQAIPILFKDEVFVEAFEKAAIANFKDGDMDSYETSLKVFRDNKNTFDYAIEMATNEGLEKGMKKGLEKGLEKGMKKGLEKGIEEGLEKGLEKGIEKGIEKGKMVIARQAKLEGIDSLTISKITGLSLEEIEKL